MIRDRVGAGDEAENEGGGKRKHGKEEHLKRGHAEAACFDEVDDGVIFHPGFTTSTQRFPIVTERFQKAMIALFIACGAWL